MTESAALRDWSASHRFLGCTVEISTGYEAGDPESAILTEPGGATYRAGGGTAPHPRATVR